MHRVTSDTMEVLYSGMIQMRFNNTMGGSLGALGFHGTSI